LTSLTEHQVWLIMASVSHDIADIFCHASVEHVEEDDEEFEVSGARDRLFQGSEASTEKGNDQLPSLDVSGIFPEEGAIRVLFCL
jgi:hypothetical protein